MDASRGEPVALKSGGNFPQGKLRILVPSAPGGGWDETARIIADAMHANDISPFPVEVVNVPGEGGLTALEQLVNEHPNDAHTMMMTGRVMIGSLMLNKDVNTSSLSLLDVTPLARLTAEYEVVIVPRNSPYHTLGELLAAFQNDPASFTWVGGARGGADHILVAQLARAVGLNPGRIVYVERSGGAEAVNDILRNQATAGVSGAGEWSDLIATGAVRALGVSSAERLPLFPDLPTLQEGGADVVVVTWRGIVGPPGVGEEESAWLIDALTRMSQTSDWQGALLANGWDDAFMTGDTFKQFIAADESTVAELLRRTGLLEAIHPRQQ
jgi:putative tricarboxylic transport membrane protein